ncbi:MAG: diguanylate cyclase [Sulfitobacter sp.]
MTLPIGSDALDVLCPMHLQIDGFGTIIHVGPTLKKMVHQEQLVGRPLLEVFEVKRPRNLTSSAELYAAARQKLTLKINAPPQTTFKGILVPTGNSNGDMVLNISFGISILDGVRDYALTNADFAVTDLAIEMLFLVEAKSAVMEASRRLNARLQGAKRQAEEQAFTDTLTGLQNRRGLEADLELAITANTPFAVMQIDLDYFKTVNDTLGHAAGDHVLIRVAEIMRAETRAEDTVSRVGGDEFTIVLTDVWDEETLRRAGRRIIRELEVPIPFEGTDCRISASIGTVWIQPGGPSSGIKPTMSDLLADADVALYASKNAGRATHTLYEPGLRTAANAVAPPSSEATSEV